MNYSHSELSTGGLIPQGTKVETTTTRTRDDIVTSLTNIDTKSDAWGKVIPMGFGRHRVAGALVWASQFYKTTESFDDLTQQKSTIQFLDSQDVHTYDSVTGSDHYVVNTPLDIVKSSGSQVTHGTTQNAYIDLCYSFGTEGDTRKQRYIEKIRINDTIVYDQSESPPFIADGIGLSFRYGYDNAPPDLLAKYPNGKFYYPGQTLVIFDKFPLALFGNSTPNSVDVEWGCCVGQGSSSIPPIVIDPPPDGGNDTPPRLKFSAQGGSGGAATVNIPMQQTLTLGGTIVLMTVRNGAVRGKGVPSTFAKQQSLTIGKYTFEVWTRPVDQAAVDETSTPGNHKMLIYQGDGDYNADEYPRSDTSPFIDLFAILADEGDITNILMQPVSGGSYDPGYTPGGSWYITNLLCYTNHVTPGTEVNPLILYNGTNKRTGGFGNYLQWFYSGGSPVDVRPDQMAYDHWVGQDMTVYIKTVGNYRS